MLFFSQGCGGVAQHVVIDSSLMSTDTQAEQCTAVEWGAAKHILVT